MTSLTVLYRRPSDPDAFRRHYEQQHPPLTRALPGVKDLRYSLHLDTLAGDAEIFATFRAAFSSRDALDAALASARGRRPRRTCPPSPTAASPSLSSG